ncbi:hypothetical protein, partial [Alcanivorax sp. HI0044]|uniref:hypothetical protein n=1 Tax=Alcanivorax sp. HI0044 TaxID=1822234 RepID=UPI001E44F1A1
MAKMPAPKRYQIKLSAQAWNSSSLSLGSHLERCSYSGPARMPQYLIPHLRYRKPMIQAGPIIR